jgi:hypothetical protein
MPRTDLAVFCFLLGLSVAWLLRSLLDYWAARGAPEPVNANEQSFAPPPVPKESLALTYRRAAAGLTEALWLTGYALGYQEATNGRVLSVLHAERLRAEDAPPACRTFADRHGELLANAFVDGANAFERGLRREGTFDDEAIDRAHALAWHAIAGNPREPDDESDTDPPGVAS